MEKNAEYDREFAKMWTRGYQFPVVRPTWSGPPVCCAEKNVHKICAALKLVFGS